MTKRLIIAVCSIGISLAVCICAYLYLLTNSKDFIKEIEIVTAKVDSGNDYAEDISKLISTWERKSKKFGILLKHSDADNLDKRFIVIENYMNTENTDELIEALTECKAEFMVMLEGEKPALENIF